MFINVEDLDTFLVFELDGCDFVLERAIFVSFGPALLREKSESIGFLS